jgi:GNAT superfamily N-acetyltransferase
VDSPEEYAKLIAVYCQENFLGTNIIQTSLYSVLSGSRRYERCYWWILCREDVICGLAMRTCPFGYVLHCVDLGTLPCFAEQLVDLEFVDQTSQLFPNICGSKQTIYQFRTIYEEMYEQRRRHILNSESTSFPELRRAKGEESELLYALSTLIPPKPRSEKEMISFIHPTPEDEELVCQWLEMFIQETGMPFPNLRHFVRQNVLNSVNYYFLIVNGMKVTFGGRTSVASCGEEDKKLARIAPIFTPPQFRNHGYASVMTAFLAQEILDQGGLPMLFTQAHNPISNSIYQKIGFEFVEENVKLLYD